MTTADDRARPGGVTRRLFMQSLGSTAAVTTLSTVREVAGAAVDETPDGPSIRGPGPITVALTVNGEPRSVMIEPATTLLDALRVSMQVTGPKEICDRGSCGGCSVLVNGTLVVACMMLATDAEGAAITTVEGLAKDGRLDPVQECFIRHDALQCGYCTPGLVVACRALLARTPQPTLAEIKSGLSGNICRCGTYTNVFNAVLEASGQSPINDAPVPAVPPA